MVRRLGELCVESPLGTLLLTALDDALLSVRFVERRTEFHTAHRAAATLGLARKELEEYFAGELEEFTVRLARRASAFQLSVLDAVRAIPSGQKRSYSEIAHSIGAPRAVRAVGGANANNPWPIIVPCHRVVGSNGRLTGYAGGLERKEWLLRHEGALAPA